jgi:hypothetical protein
LALKSAFTELVVIRGLSPLKVIGLPISGFVLPFHFDKFRFIQFANQNALSKNRESYRRKKVATLIDERF